MNLIIRNLRPSDCQIISDAFFDQGWNKPIEQYQQYLNDTLLGIRDVLVAFVDDNFVGYVCILWQSLYPGFQEQGIPEIVDLNVLIRYRNMGIGSSLLKEAEHRISQRSQIAGIGVGLFRDYGHAQRLYIKHGYIPDGQGIWSKGRTITYGESITIDDDVALYLIKQLKEYGNV